MYSQVNKKMHKKMCEIICIGKFSVNNKSIWKKSFISKFWTYTDEKYDGIMIEDTSELLVNIDDNTILELANLQNRRNEWISNYAIHVTGVDVRSNAKEQLILCFESMLMNFYHNLFITGIQQNIMQINHHTKSIWKTDRET